jgi:uncharacterized protein (TIGR00661 family)
MRFLILVKGDGRGHLTQAMSLTQLLMSRGHTVTSIVIGAPAEALLPEFIFKNSPVPVERLHSPNLVLNKRQDHIDWVRTGWQGLLTGGALASSLRRFGRILREQQPDVVINLFEPLVSLARLLHRLPPIINLGHQYLMLHPEFHFPPGREVERRVISGYTALMRPAGSKTLGLSFYDMADQPEQQLYAVPPLLRREVHERVPTSGDHLVVYMVYHGISEQVKAYNAAHPEVRIHAFWSKKDVPAELRISDTLTFHQINDVLFLDLLASARGVATTAGFETVCEAFYYRKPAILMPMPGQYEQYVNAADAERVGAGKLVPDLDPQRLEDFLPHYQPQHEAYLMWMQRGLDRLIWHLEHPTDRPAPNHPSNGAETAAERIHHSA